MTENPIYLMVLRDFERFPEMWMCYVDRRRSSENPLRALADALDSKNLAAAQAAFEAIPAEVLATPTGQIGRAMLDFGKSDQLKEWMSTK